MGLVSSCRSEEGCQIFPKAGCLDAQTRQLFCYTAQALSDLEVGVKEEGDMRGFRFLKTPFLWIAGMVRVTAIAVGRMATR